MTLSNLWLVVALEPDEVLEGIIFLKKMFEVTKTTAEPNAQRRPRALEADMSKLQASMTPMVSGTKEK